jgi:hypothetical protein
VRLVDTPAPVGERQRARGLPACGGLLARAIVRATMRGSVT